MANDDMKTPAATRLPEDVLIILPVRNTVMFPGMVLPLTVGRQQSIAAAQEAARCERPIGIIQQRDPGVETPGPDVLYKIGTVATILRYVTSAEGTPSISVHRQQRSSTIDYLNGP